MLRIKIGIVILNWNGATRTIRCLESIVTGNDVPFVITIIDNGSDENDVEIIKTYIGTKRSERNSILIKIIENRTNLGFAVAANLGISEAYSDGCTHALVLNNDTHFKEDTLKKLVESVARYPEFVCYSPLIRVSGSKRIWSAGGSISWYFKLRGNSENDLNGIPGVVKSVGFITGCAIVFSKVNQEIRFSEDYFFGEEDFELSLRLTKEGKKLGVIVDAEIFHDVSATANAVSTPGVSRVFYFMLCRLITIRKHASGVQRALSTILCYLYLFFRVQQREGLFEAFRLLGCFYAEGRGRKFADKDVFTRYFLASNRS